MLSILLNKFNTPFEAVPFDQIDQEAFKPAIIQLIEDAKAEVDTIVNNPASPDFANTIVALERSGHQLNRVAEAFFNLASAETNDYLEKVQEEVSPLLAAFGNDITLNTGLFKRVKTIFEQTDRESFSAEDWRLLEKTYKRFVRNGALLGEQEKEQLRNIDKELATLKVKFSQNVLQETNSYFLHLQEESQLDGLPESSRTQAKEEAKARGVEGWVFTLQYPSLMPFLQYASNRNLRKELYLANGTKAYKDNEYNNEEAIKRIVTLREQRAKLLGYATHAAFVLEERMAGNPDTVFDFIQDLLQKAKPYAIKDIEAFKPLAKQDGLETLMPYDHAYYAEKLRKQKYDYSEEELKPYFSLDKVLEAAFLVAERLYGLSFHIRKDIPKYHEEVEVYEVMEKGIHKALLYTDWFPRKGKRAGAWMTSYKGQYKQDDQNHRPHISIVCNFSRPVDNTPSLLTFTEVTTLFHEFGHALHGILADTVYESLSGTNVYWDFVELPSQFMENYCYEKEFLSEFARHYETGALLPEEKIDKIIASSNYMEGYQTLRQLSFGVLDMAYHTGRLTGKEAVEEFEKKTTKEMQLYPPIEGVSQSHSFSHIFPGGYSAGYYSYKWSEVLDADAFAYFKETGIFNPEAALKFKTLLSKGGTIDPMELYVTFRGRKPSPDALLKRAGLYA